MDPFGPKRSDARSRNGTTTKESDMKSRLILFTVAITLIGLSVGCIVPGQERGRGDRREERRDDRRDQRPEPSHDRDHEEHGHMSGLAH